MSVRSRRRRVRFDTGELLALGSAAVVLITTFLTWFRADADNAYELGSEILVDSSFGDDKGFIGIGFLLLFCVVLIVAGVFVREIRFLPIVGGGLTSAIALLFVFQVNNLLGNAEEATGGVAPGLFNIITYYPLLTAIAGVGAICGGVLTLQQR